MKVRSYSEVPPLLLNLLELPLMIEVLSHLHQEVGSHSGECQDVPLVCCDETLVQVKMMLRKRLDRLVIYVPFSILLVDMVDRTYNADVQSCVGPL